MSQRQTGKPRPPTVLPRCVAVSSMEMGFLWPQLTSRLRPFHVTGHVDCANGPVLSVWARDDAILTTVPDLRQDLPMPMAGALRRRGSGILVRSPSAAPQPCHEEKQSQPSSPFQFSRHRGSWLL